MCEFELVLEFLELGGGAGDGLLVGEELGGEGLVLAGEGGVVELEGGVLGFRVLELIAGVLEFELEEFGLRS